MKIKSYLLAGLAMLAMASCDDSFNDWIQQATNTEKDAITFGNGTVNEVGLIDFANLPEGTDSVQVCTISAAPTTSSDTYKPSYSIIFSYTNPATSKVEETTLNMSKDGKVAFSELKSYVEATYGKRPTERDLASVARVSFSNGTTATYLNSDNFTVKVKPQAPEIEQAYYYIGAANGWSTTDQTYKLTNSGLDVYDDPEFSVVVPVVYEDGKRKDNWFKIAPASAYSAPDFWAYDKFIGAATNGESAAEGSFVQGKDAQAFNINDADAKYYKITFNLMTRKYKVEGLNFSEYLYMAGNVNDWHQIDFLSTSTYDGKYTGFMYLDTNGFKFCSQADWNGKNYGAGAADGTLSEAGGNITSLPEGDGYYKVDVDLSKNTVAYTRIKTIGMIGDATAGGWSEDTPMTYNATERCWEAKGVTLKKGDLKFRANNDWTINWGGKGLAALTQGGDNLKVEAGTYDVQLFAWCNGKAYAVLTRK